MFATPIGYLVDETGVIETGVGVGADEILDLLSRAENAKTREVMIGRN